MSACCMATASISAPVSTWAKRWPRAAGQTSRRASASRHSWHEVFDIIARGPVPFVAALHGAVVGGGLELATAAHIRVADETAFFGLPEGQRGIFVGGGGTVRIQRVVGYTVMADMMLTGRLLSAAEGRANTSCATSFRKARLWSRRRELAAVIAKNTPDTNWRITNLLPRINDLSHDDGLFVEYLNSNMRARPRRRSACVNSWTARRSRSSVPDKRS